MANNVKGNKNNSQKNTNKKSTNTKKLSKNEIIMKVLVVLGVIVLCVAIIYLMNYFFVEKNYIKINMSTDRKMEYINVGQEEVLITTQKYVSDLDYSMRYDTNAFKVFKYRNQDIFKYLDSEKVLVVVEKASLPEACSNGGSSAYSSCVITVDNYTEERYISTNGEVYKLTIKTPSSSEYKDDIKSRISYMLGTFESTLK